MVSSNERIESNKKYRWDVNSRLESITDVSNDSFGNLASANYNEKYRDYKLTDEIGNLFKTKEKKDRNYGKAGQLLKDEKISYSYDHLGNPIQKESLTKKTGV